MKAPARMRLFALAAIAVALPSTVGSAEPHAASEAALVEIAGASRRTACAEEDNVTIEMRGSGITRFTIIALPPPYLDTVTADSTAPDFSGCQINGAADHRFAPRTLRLLDTPELRLMGHTFAQFWRPEHVPFAVGAIEETGLHLVQVLVPWRGDWREILVLYPTDGYWRAKPLPPPHLSDTAYGSSFLLGPIEDGGRPLVALSRIVFEPEQRRFQLMFARGGTATLQVREASAVRLALDVRLQPALAAGQPFAALRSMYVADSIADAAVVAWQPAAGAPWQTLPILDLIRQRATAVRFGRDAVSRHNTSAPDLHFGPFSTADSPPAPG